MNKLTDELISRFYNGVDTDFNGIAKYVERLILEERLKEAKQSMNYIIVGKQTAHILDLTAQLEKLK